MQTNIIIDKNYAAPRAEIYTPELSEEVRWAAAMLKSGAGGDVVLERDGALFPVHAADVECFYTAGGRVEARTVNGDAFCCRKKIYELEEELGGRFIKLNQGAIANLDRVKCFSFLFNGTMEAVFESGNKEYVSRRNVGKIKITLGIGGKQK